MCMFTNTFLLLFGFVPLGFVTLRSVTLGLRASLNTP